MNIDIGLKCLLQVSIIGEVREDAQFNLGIIRLDQLAPTLGDKGLAQLLAPRGANGNILQIGLT